MQEESRRSWGCHQQPQPLSKSSAVLFTSNPATDRHVPLGSGGQSTNGIRSNMSIIHPTWSEPVVPGIPDHEIYEDEEDDD
jgi:hypothetical protein